MGFVLANKCVCDVSFPACIWDVIWFKTCYPEAIHTSGGPSLYLNQVPKSIGVDRDLFYWNSCTAVVRNPLKYYTALFQCSSHHIASNVRFPERPLIGQLFFFFVGNVFERGVGSGADVENLFTLLTAFRRDRVWIHIRTALVQYRFTRCTGGTVFKSPQSCTL